MTDNNSNEPGVNDETVIRNPNEDEDGESSGRDQPTTGQDGSNGRDQPTTGQNQPTTGGKQPSTGGNQPTTGQNQPTTGGKQPSTGGNQPTTGANQPSTGGNQPTTGQNQPSTGQNQPTTGGNQPTTGQNQPTTGGNQPTTGGSQPSTGQDQPSTGGRQSAGASTATGTGTSSSSGTGLDSNVAGALAYLFAPLGGIAMYVLEDDDFVQFHAVQGIAFGVLMFLVWIGATVVWFLGGILLGGQPVIGVLWGLVSLLMYPIVGFIGFALWAFLTYKAYQGERYGLPVIGGFAGSN